MFRTVVSDGTFADTPAECKRSRPLDYRGWIMFEDVHGSGSHQPGSIGRKIQDKGQRPKHETTG